MTEAHEKFWEAINRLKKFRNWEGSQDVGTFYHGNQMIEDIDTILSFTYPDSGNKIALLTESQCINLHNLRRLCTPETLFEARVHKSCMCGCGCNDKRDYIDKEIEDIVRIISDNSIEFPPIQDE